MRDQYAGDVSDVLKFAFLRALAGADRTLGIAWYYAPGDDGRPDGRHLEWRDEAAWRLLDEELHAGPRRCPNAALPLLNRRRSGPREHCFIVSRCRRVSHGARGGHGSGARSTGRTSYFSTRTMASAEKRRSMRLPEIRLLRKPERAIVFITFPGRSMTHDALLRQLHGRLMVEADAGNLITLRTNVSVPRTAGSRSYVQRQRWFTVVDPDAELTVSAQAFAAALASVPRVRSSARWYQVSVPRGIPRHQRRP